MVLITDYQVKQREVGVNDIHQKHKVKILAFYMSMSMFRGEGGFLSELKNREGGLHEKGRGKGGKGRKKKRVIKHSLKYLYEA